MSDPGIVTTASPTNPTPQLPEQASPGRSTSIFRKRVQKFRRIKRGYYSFLTLVIAYAISFILPVLINNKPLIVSYNGEWSFPVAKYYPADAFGLTTVG